MKHLSEILEGYCDPETRKHAIKVIGETGLTVRIRSLCYFDGAIRSMLRPRFYEFARSDFESFWPILQMLRQCWATEFIRITDKSHSTVKRVVKDHLTIGLFHERFQADTSISLIDRQTEHDLFKAVETEHKAHQIWQFRCEAWFHLDLNSNLHKPRVWGGDIHRMTMLVLSWYKFVGGYVIGDGDLAYVTKAGLTGKRFVKEVRQMMFAQWREWSKLSLKRQMQSPESSA